MEDQMKNEFELSEANIKRFRKIAESMNKSMIDFGSALKPVADKVVEAFSELDKIAYNIMREEYIKHHGSLPDASKESVKWAVRSWYFENVAKMDPDNR